ncbi:MAG: hypothetical protein AABY22_00350 [Nanoarchaeota archaeon]
MASKKRNSGVSKGKKKVSQGLAIVALLLNILILPGLGSLIGGRTRTGIIQLILVVVSIPLLFILVGIPLLIAVWIWALITGIQIIKGAR